MFWLRAHQSLVAYVQPIGGQCIERACLKQCRGLFARKLSAGVVRVGLGAVLGPDKRKTKSGAISANPACVFWNEASGRERFATSLSLDVGAFSTDAPIQRRHDEFESAPAVARLVLLCTG